MKLTIKENSKNYVCTIVEIKNLFPIEGADKIQRCNINANDVVVSIDVKIGDVMLYFNSGTKLNSDFCKYNNLLTDKTLNKDVTKVGYISHKQFRVKAVKMRGVISDGMLLPLSSLDFDIYLQNVPLKVGDEFTDINDISICEKYIVAQARNSNPGGKAPKVVNKLKDLLLETQFRFHHETEHFVKHQDKFTQDTEIIITRKFHGCLPKSQPIKMFDGSNKTIGKIQRGDKVLGFCAIENKYKESEVLATTINGKTDLWLRFVKTHNSVRKAAHKERLICTENHKIYSNGKYVEAKELKIGDKVLSFHYIFDLKEEVKSFLIGKMLGDGSVDKHNKKYALCISHKKEHKDYISHCRMVCPALFTEYTQQRVSGYGTEMMISRTKQDFSLNNLFSPYLDTNLQKTFPKNLVLNPIILAYWYMDDGNLTHTNFQKDRAGIAICAYKEKDIPNIKRALDNFGFSNYKIFNDKNGYLRLRFNHSDAVILFDRIHSLIPPIMRYKLPEEYRNKEYDTLKDYSLDTIIQEIDETILTIEKLTPKQNLDQVKKYDIQTTTSNYVSGGILIHNSSLILSNVLVNKQLPLKDKIFNFFGAKIPNEEYGVIWSSGKPKGKLPKGIESDSNKWQTSNPSYYTSDIWGRAYKEVGHTLEKGISLYGEIVGNGIQGDKFTYNQEYGIHIYRITRTSVEGNVDELSWEAVKQYCAKYGLTYVQEYFVGKVKELVVLDENLLGYLQQLYLNKSYPDCEIDEGICVRVRNNNEIFKLKSPNFIKMESDDQEKEVSNIEDNA